MRHESEEGRKEIRQSREPTELEIPRLQPGEKVIGTAYLTQDGEIVPTAEWVSWAIFEEYDVYV